MHQRKGLAPADLRARPVAVMPARASTGAQAVRRLRRRRRCDTWEAQSFYAVSGGRVVGCGPNDTLTINAECTSYRAGLVIGPAVPIETWVAAQVQGALNDAQTQNQRLQRQLDELTSRVQALEACLKRSTPGATTK